MRGRHLSAPTLRVCRREEHNYRVNILIMSSAARITTVKYTVDDHISAEFIRDIQLGRLTFDSADILNTVLYSVVTDCVVNV